MAAIGYASAEQLTAQPHTGDATWTDVTGAVIADADITDSGEYLIVVTTQGIGSSFSFTFGLRLVHGTTPTVFAGSTKIFEPGSGGLNYFYIHKFTASASSGENIMKLQFQTVDTGQTVTADTIQMWAINLDDLDAADFFYGEDDDTAGVTAFTTSFADFATTGEFTPANTDDDWLVMFCMNHAVNDLGINTVVRSRLDGSTATPDDDAPQYSEEGEDVTAQLVYGLVRPHTLSAAAHQFWVQGADDATGGTDQNDHIYSAIVALRLNAFSDHAIFWSEDFKTFTTADVLEEVGNVDITPSVTSDVFVIGSAVFDSGGADKKGHLITQLGGADTPAGKIDHFDYSKQDSDDENPTNVMFIIPDASGAQDIDMDASVNDTAQHIEDRALVAFTAELASTAQVITLSPISLPVLVNAPSIAGSGSAPVTLSPLTLPVAVAAPAISGSGPVSLSPSPLTLPVLAVAPVVAATGSAPISPTPLAILLEVIEEGTFPGTGIEATGSAPIGPSPLGVPVVVVAPSIDTGGQFVTLSPLTLVVAVAAPVIIGSGSAPVSPSPLTLPVLVAAPVAAATGSAPISPSPLALPVAVAAPAIIGSGSAPVSPSPLTLVILVVSPSVDLPSTIIGFGPLIAVVTNSGPNKVDFRNLARNRVIIIEPTPNQAVITKNG